MKHHGFNIMCTPQYIKLPMNTMTGVFSVSCIKVYQSSANVHLMTEHIPTPLHYLSKRSGWHTGTKPFLLIINCTACTGRLFFVQLPRSSRSFTSLPIYGVMILYTQTTDIYVFISWIVYSSVLPPLLLCWPHIRLDFHAQGFQLVSAALLHT